MRRGGERREKAAATPGGWAAGLISRGTYIEACLEHTQDKEILNNLEAIPGADLCTIHVVSTHTPYQVYVLEPPAPAVGKVGDQNLCSRDEVGGGGKEPPIAQVQPED